VFLDVGRALVVSILDLEAVNPLSRLLKSEGETLEGALKKLRETIKS